MCDDMTSHYGALPTNDHKEKQRFNELLNVTDNQSVEEEEGACNVAANNMDELWSPRLSFSRDFVVSDCNSLPQHCLSDGDHDMTDKAYSADFEFVPSCEGQCFSEELLKGLMLSADELFCDGKILPSPFPSCESAHDEVPVSWPEAEEEQPARMSITIEAPKSSSSSAFSLRPKCACISLPCESDSHSTTPTAAAARRPSSASSSSTTVSMPPLATRLKTLFKSKKSSSELQFQRRESVSQSSCRVSISTKTFWPFSRSHSVGESKTAVRPAVHYRSNSAGQIHSFMDSSMKKADLFDFTMSSSSTATHQFNRQEPALQICERKFDNGEERILAKGNNDDNTRLDLLRATNDSGTNSSGIGSPVRREAISVNCGSKAHAGIARSNLELHSAKRRLSSSRGWRGLDRRGSFPVGTRVSPVLNVAVYGGSSLPKISIFGLNYLPLLRKVKPVVDTLGCRNRS